MQSRREMMVTKNENEGEADPHSQNECVFIRTRAYEHIYETVCNGNCKARNDTAQTYQAVLHPNSRNTTIPLASKHNAT